MVLEETVISLPPHLSQALPHIIACGYFAERTLLGSAVSGPFTLVELLLRETFRIPLQDMASLLLCPLHAGLHPGTSASTSPQAWLMPTQLPHVLQL